MRHNIANVVKVSALALALSFGISFVYAWTAPTVAAPGGNVAAPINTSATAQTKAGDFTLTGAAAKVTAPNYCIGASCINTWTQAGNTYTAPASGGLSLSLGAFSINAANLTAGCTTATGVGKLYWNGSALACGTDQTGGASGVTSLTAGTGITLSPNPITTTGTITADTTILQKRVAAAGCAAGSSIRVVNADGTVVCQLDNVGGGDNLGNHTATTNLNMAGHAITGLPGGAALSWGGNNIYSDGSGGNMALRMSGGLFVQNQAGTANSGVVGGYFNGDDYYIRNSSKWTSQLVQSVGAGSKVTITGTATNPVVNATAPVCTLTSQILNDANCYVYTNCPAGWVLTGRTTNGEAGNMCKERSICSKITCL